MKRVKDFVNKKITLNRWVFLNILVILFFMGVVGGPVFLSCSDSKPIYQLSASGNNPLANADTQVDAIKMQDAFHNVAKQVNPAVVFISTESERTVRVPQFDFFNFPFFDFMDPQNRGRNRSRPQYRQRKQIQRGLGSGFIISADGYIVTNDHVVHGAQKIKVKIEHDKEYDAKVIGTDDILDIALIKIEAKNLPHVYLGDSDNTRVGDWAIAIGNPYGLSHTFTVGVISHINRKNIDEHGIGQFIQTDASINRGNSGGPLLNIRGEVIGINRMIYSNTGGSIGIGFAIPINEVKVILEQLRKNGKVIRGWLGVQIQPNIAEEFRKELGLKGDAGVFVARVVPGSPAQKAGIQERDVILEINGKKIQEFSDLSSIVKQTKPGKTLPFLVWRNKKQIKIWVTIREYQNPREKK